LRRGKNSTGMESWGEIENTMKSNHARLKKKKKAI
jgi:hypothetical protein